MNWTTASMKLGDNQAQISGTNMNKLTTRGGILWSYESIAVEYKYNFYCYTVLSLYFLIPSSRSASYII